MQIAPELRNGDPLPSPILNSHCIVGVYLGHAFSSAETQTSAFLVFKNCDISILPFRSMSKPSKNSRYSDLGFGMCAQRVSIFWNHWASCEYVHFTPRPRTECGILKNVNCLSNKHLSCLLFQVAISISSFFCIVKDRDSQSLRSLCHMKPCLARPFAWNTVGNVPVILFCIRTLRDLIDGSETGGSGCPKRCPG